MVPPHVQSDGPHYLMLEQVRYGPPPHVRYNFFSPASKEVHCVSYQIDSKENIERSTINFTPTQDN